MGSSRDAVSSVTLSMAIMSEIRKVTKRDADKMEIQGKGKNKFMSIIVYDEDPGSREEMPVGVVYMNNHHHRYHQPMPPLLLRLINCLPHLSRDVLQPKIILPSARANQRSSIKQMLGCQGPDSRDAEVFACGSETRLACTSQGTFSGSCTSLAVPDYLGNIMLNHLHGKDWVLLHWHVSEINKTPHAHGWRDWNGVCRRGSGRPTWGWWFGEWWRAGGLLYSALSRLRDEGMDGWIEGCL